MTPRRAVPWISRSTLLVLVACAPFTIPAVAEAQPQRPAESALLLRRIAEALDGYRTGATVFVVASNAYPNEVIGVFPQRPDADAAARLRAGLGVYGPFRTLPDDDPMRPRPRFGCIHTGPSIMGPRMCPDLRMPIASIRSLSLLVTGTDGREERVPLPEGMDALFLGMPAIDKFVIPYYLRILGLDGAARMRAQFDSVYRSR